jgi:hypothetical protein
LPHGRSKGGKESVVKIKALENQVSDLTRGNEKRDRDIEGNREIQRRIRKIASSTETGIKGSLD